MTITKLTGFKTSDGKTHSRYTDAKKWNSFLKFESILETALRDAGVSVDRLPTGTRGLATRLYGSGFRYVPSSIAKSKLKGEING